LGFLHLWPAQLAGALIEVGAQRLHVGIDQHDNLARLLDEERPPLEVGAKIPHRQHPVAQPLWVTLQILKAERGRGPAWPPELLSECPSGFDALADHQRANLEPWRRRTQTASGTPAQPPARPNILRPGRWPPSGSGGSGLVAAVGRKPGDMHAAHQAIAIGERRDHRRRVGAHRAGHH
jgi:hypothetical protein